MGGDRPASTRATPDRIEAGPPAPPRTRHPAGAHATAGSRHRRRLRRHRTVRSLRRLDGARNGGLWMCSPPPRHLDAHGLEQGVGHGSKPDERVIEPGARSHDRDGSRRRIRHAIQRRDGRKHSLRLPGNGRMLSPVRRAPRRVPQKTRVCDPSATLAVHQLAASKAPAHSRHPIPRSDAGIRRPRSQSRGSRPCACGRIRRLVAADGRGR